MESNAETWRKVLKQQLNSWKKPRNKQKKGR